MLGRSGVARSCTACDRLLLRCAFFIVLVGCGRIGFDLPIGGGDGSNGVPGDGDMGDGPLAVSCSSLQATCGASGSASCCGSARVTGGMFFRNYDVGDDALNPDMTHPATLSDFTLDTYEVTVGRFRQFVDAGKGIKSDPPQAGAGARTLNGMPNQGGWQTSWNNGLVADTAALVAALSCDPTFQTWTPTPGANESLPISCITWYEAFAFCVWDGGFLPTSAEYNFAAIGGAEQRAYPWSNPPSSTLIDCTRANYWIGGATYCVSSPTGAADRVGARPTGVGPWGHADLSGNMGEWVLDCTGPLPDPCNDCAELTSCSSRVARGGNFVAASIQQRPARVGLGTPNSRNYAYGVRCAR